MTFKHFCKKSLLGHPAKLNHCKSLENLVATGALLLRNTETVLVSCIENNAILYTNKSTETIQRKKNTILYNHNLMSCY